MKNRLMLVAVGLALLSPLALACALSRSSSAYPIVSVLGFLGAFPGVILLMAGIWYKTFRDPRNSSTHAIYPDH